ncbi:MAG: DsbA family protein [Candidatus Peribacteraceae bacterium]|nr:DsbA family protein [Candidatus Peribacteraceae bacterium]
MTIQWKSSSADTGASSTGTIWFPVSIGLIGIIVGFGLANLVNVRIPSNTGTPPPVPPSAAAPAAPRPPAEPQVAQEVPPVDPEKDHIRGNPNAQVAVIEYSDFECPFCKRVHPTYQQIMKEYGDKVMWVYRHYPLGFHQNAQKEAEATECANELGGNDAFWKFTDGIVEKTTSNGTGFPLDQLPVLAKEIGLSETKFKSCLDSGKYAQHVKDDMDGGSKAGVSGTPGNIILNVKTQKNTIISGAQPFANFKSAIDALLP